MNKENKPKKTVEELIQMLKCEKGVIFRIMTEEEAIKYLSEINNFLRTASYRKNYEKYQSGDHKGRYIALEFVYMTELSTIDMYLRRLAFEMCIDIEHALKTQLISVIENNASEDGYHIVNLFFKKYPDVLRRIIEKAESMYTGALVEKYFSLCYVYDVHDPKIYRTAVFDFACPAWVLVELLSFGDMLKLISLYNDVYPDQVVKIPTKNILSAVKSLRNACAHNNCLLNNLHRGDTRPPSEVSQYVAGIKTIGKEERIKKLSCRPVYELVCMFMAYHECVSDRVRENGFRRMREFVNGRMMLHRSYFDQNIIVKTSFDFLQKILDNFV